VKAVGQLSPENLEMQEDGQKVQVTDSGGEEQGRPVDIVVAFDITESMQPYMTGMKEATIDFAIGLSKSEARLPSWLVTFEDYVFCATTRSSPAVPSESKVG